MQESMRILKKNLELEFKNILFYINNLEKLNYTENKRLLNKLIDGSFEHAKINALCIYA